MMWADIQNAQRVDSVFHRLALDADAPDGKIAHTGQSLCVAHEEAASQTLTSCVKHRLYRACTSSIQVRHYMQQANQQSLSKDQHDVKQFVRHRIHYRCQMMNLMCQTGLIVSSIYGSNEKDFAAMRAPKSLECNLSVIRLHILWCYGYMFWKAACS